MGKSPLGGGDSPSTEVPVDLPFRRERVGVFLHSGGMGNAVSQAAVWRVPCEFLGR